MKNIVLIVFAVSCGYSEQEMQLARDRQELTMQQLEQCWERNPIQTEEMDGGTEDNR